MISLVIMALLASPPAIAPQQQEEKKPQPSLAELAKATRKKKTDASGQTRVITNADLKSLRSRVSTGSSPVVRPPSEMSAEAGEPGQEGEPVQPGEGGGLTEEELARWKEAFDEARTNLSNAVNEGLVLQLRMNNLRNSYLRQSDGTTQQRIQQQLTETMQALEKNRNDQVQAREAIKILQREARAAGLTQREISELTGKLPEPPPEIVSQESIQ